MFNMMYKKLFLMTILSFISMYILMYMMVDRYINIYPNLSQFYMAIIMVIPMIIIELFIMKSMYNNTKVNILITVFSLLIFFGSITLLRKQVFISDKEFLKSMIPHHAAALIMCKNASLQNPELKDLCKNIILTQQSEIDFMKSKLEGI